MDVRIKLLTKANSLHVQRFSRQCCLCCMDERSRSVADNNEGCYFFLCGEHLFTSTNSELVSVLLLELALWPLVILWSDW